MDIKEEDKQNKFDIGSSVSDGISAGLSSNIDKIIDLDKGNDVDSNVDLTETLSDGELGEGFFDQIGEFISKGLDSIEF